MMRQKIKSEKSLVNLVKLHTSRLCKDLDSLNLVILSLQQKLKTNNMILIYLEMET